MRASISATTIGSKQAPANSIKATRPAGKRGPPREAAPGELLRTEGGEGRRVGAVVVLSTRQALLTPVPTRAELPAVRFSPTYQRLASALVGSSVSVSLYGALSKPLLVYTSDVDAVDWIASVA